MAATVNDPEYQAALARFNRQLRRLYRAAGEPPYRVVARDCAVSVTSVHRYLNGVILPRMIFVSKFITIYGDEIVQVLSGDELRELRARWMDVRDVLKPLGTGGDQNEVDASLDGGAEVRRLMAAQEGIEDASRPGRRRSA